MRVSEEQELARPALEQLQFLANDLQETLRKRMPLVNFTQVCRTVVQEISRILFCPQDGSRRAV